MSLVLSHTWHKERKLSVFKPVLPCYPHCAYSPGEALPCGLSPHSSVQRRSWGLFSAQLWRVVSPVILSLCLVWMWGQRQIYTALYSERNKESPASLCLFPASLLGYHFENLFPFHVKCKSTPAWCTPILARWVVSLGTFTHPAFFPEQGFLSSSTTTCSALHFQLTVHYSIV